MDSLFVFPLYKEVMTASQPLEAVAAAHYPAPVIVGAVGGSGSRLAVSMLEELGVMMSPYGNPGKDSALWPPMERINDSPAARCNSRDVLLAQTFRALETLWQRRQREHNVSGPVGLKVPNSFRWLPELADYFPQMRYILVLRNGLDMAFSNNQAQFRANSWYFGIDGREADQLPPERIDPVRMLDYWLAANRFAIEQGRQHLGERFHILDFDQLCRQPREEVAKLLAFLGQDAAAVERLASLVQPPGSLGRHQRYPWREVFSEQQLAAVDALMAEAAAVV